MNSSIHNLHHNPKFRIYVIIVICMIAVHAAFIYSSGLDWLSKGMLFMISFLGILTSSVIFRNANFQIPNIERRPYYRIFLKFFFTLNVIIISFFLAISAYMLLIGILPPINGIASNPLISFPNPGLPEIIMPYILPIILLSVAQLSHIIILSLKGSSFIKYNLVFFCMNFLILTPLYIFDTYWSFFLTFYLLPLIPIILAIIIFWKRKFLLPRHRHVSSHRVSQILNLWSMHLTLSILSVGSVIWILMAI